MPLEVYGLPSAVEGTQPYGPRFFYMNVLASPVAVATIVVVEQSITVTGLAAGDMVLSINKPTINGAIGVINGRVSSANTLAMTFANPTAGSVTPTAAEVYKLFIFRPAA
jgi:hypothetical protein